MTLCKHNAAPPLPSPKRQKLVATWQRNLTTGRIDRTWGWDERQDRNEGGGEWRHRAA